MPRLATRRRARPASGIQADGSVWLVIDKAQFDIQNGDVFLGVSVREDTAENPSGVLASDYAGGRQDYVVVGNDFCATPISVVSRKTHGIAGPFDIALPLTGTRGVECRTGDVTLVYTFPAPVANCGSATQGTASGGPESNQCTVTLTGLTNGQYYQVDLNGLVSSGGSADVPGPQWGLLTGDVNGNGLVSNTDIALIKGQVAAPVDASNFRNDVNANGVISNTDVSTAKGQVGATLP